MSDEWADYTEAFTQDEVRAINARESALVPVLYGRLVFTVMERDHINDQCSELMAEVTRLKEEIEKVRAAGIYLATSHGKRARAAEARADAYRLAARRLRWVARSRGILYHSAECSETYLRWMENGGEWACSCDLDGRLGPRP